MSTLLVVNQTELCPVFKRGIVTVPIEMATVQCNCVKGLPCVGLTLMGLPLSARALQAELLVMGSKFVERQEIRGYVMADDIVRLHGPWPSYDLNNKLADAASPIWDEAFSATDEAGEAVHDPTSVLSTVFEVPVENPYVDYLLRGTFLYPEHQQITHGDNT